MVTDGTPSGALTRAQYLAAQEARRPRRTPQSGTPITDRADRARAHHARAKRDFSGEWADGLPDAFSMAAKERAKQLAQDDALRSWCKYCGENLPEPRFTYCSQTCAEESLKARDRRRKRDARRDKGLLNPTHQTAPPTQPEQSKMARGPLIPAEAGKCAICGGALPRTAPKYCSPRCRTRADTLRRRLVKANAYLSS